jgi:hypothetical protein
MRMARIGDVVLLDHPADATGPRCIKRLSGRGAGFHRHQLFAV